MPDSHQENSPRLPSAYSETLGLPLSISPDHDSQNGETTGAPPSHAASTPRQQELVLSMLPLVRTIVGRLAISLPSHISQEDLLSAGIMGLMDASRRFDPGKGSSFKSYAATRIRGAILDELRRMDWIPRSVHRQARDFRKLQTELEQRLGREATEQELAQEMGISVSELDQLLETIKPASFVSLQDVRSHNTDADEDLLNEECIADPHSNTSLDASVKEEQQALIVETIKKLSPIEQKVLGLYYHQGLRLKEIAEVLNVTESRVSQIHTLAVQRIRGRLEND
ncbi:MAG: FliA/WhiG family RNA polymerase sigma factor [Verrucomicrobiae bacterium]|nr:FliA/WhiG family RNA polymerase sigma factor [Verrucomicrobiae bacterium]